jgi:hypothetical protein
MKKLLILLSLTISFAFSINAQTDIRKVDFKNFTYDVDIFEKKEKLKLKNGEFDRNTEEDKLYFVITDVVYGDLNGDGKEEAVVTTSMNTGGTGNFSSGIIFTMKNGKPFILTEFEGGDRAYGGIRSVKIDKGVFILQQNDVGEAGGACCPEFSVTTMFELKGGKLVQLGKVERRELYPQTRVKFVKGKSFAIIPIKIEKYDQKRFVIGARKGQTLSVSSSAKGVSYSLFKGEGDVENTDNGMIVKLNETGDFVFIVSNDNDKDMEFSITAEIN